MRSTIIPHRMEKKSKISILTSCYNHAEFVGQLVESVYNQKGVDFEFIVIDDGSKDNSADVLSELSLKYGFYFEAQENMGFTKTLNKLLNKATGDYIVAIASDDVLSPGRLKIQLDFLESNQDCALVCGDVIELNEKGEQGKRISHPLDMENIYKAIFLRDIFILAPTVMVRRSVVSDLGGWDENLAIEDWDMWLRIAKDHKLGYLNEVFAFYRIHSGNSHGNYEKMYTEMEKTLMKHIDSPYFEKGQGKMFHDAALYLSGFRGYKNLTLHYLKKAWKARYYKQFPKILFKWIFIWNN